MHHCNRCCIYCFDKPKGGLTLSATGYLQVHAYSSFAQIPLKDVSITVTASDGTAIAMALTDRSGRINSIAIPAPDFDISQAPDPGQIPFASVTLHARLRGYEQITAENIQIFADTVTYQELEMIPLSELPSQWSKYELFDTPPQQL